MRSKFDEQLALMKNELIQMGALCEEAISMAAKALKEGNKELAERVIPLDNDIAEIISAMLSEGYVPENVGHIDEMATETMKMVTESVESYVQQDIARARNVIAHDDLIDEFFIQVRTILIQNIVENHTSGEYILDLLMIDKYLERIGDHAVNIAEWVIFSVTGTKES